MAVHSPTQVIGLPLGMRLNVRPPSVSARTSSAAWWLDGGDAELWFDEMSGWGIEMAALRLYIVPRSIHDRTPAGALIVPPDGAAPTTSPRALPYGRLGGKLYLPVEAALSPAVSDAELAARLPWEAAILHPTIGLVGFDKTDAKSVGDLLLPPPIHVARWDRTVASEPLNARLLSVGPDQPPTADAIVESGHGDIGTQTPQNAPGSPEESKARNAAAAARKSLAKMMSWLAGGAGKAPPPSRPAAPKSPPLPGKGWRDKLRRWRQRRQQAVTDAMEAERQRELNRLLHLMATDPDQGLRYAVPLADAGGRGVAPPASRLGAHDVKFNMNALGGGQAGDTWTVSNQMRQQLIARYREAANRELQLGRYRRAAYIFAKLLGDLDAAANALKQGRHYREAAVLYRDRLKNPAAAVSCLEEGGLLLEAIEIHESLQQFEKAGDLYARIERPDEAAKAWRLAVGQALAKSDNLQAARLMERKLGSVDEALELLWTGWTKSAQLPACVEEYFNLLGRMGQHEIAAKKLTTFRRGGHLEETLIVANTLAGVATEYPDQAVRALAADLTRVNAGAALREAGTREITALVNSVTRVNAADRLLGRDGARYLSARQAVKKRPPPPAPLKKNDAVPLLHSFSLGWDVEWRGAISHEDVFFAWGEKGNQLVFLRGNFAGRMERCSTPCVSGLQRPRRMLYVPECMSLVLFASPEIPNGVVLPAGEFGVALRIGTLPLFPKSLAADRDQYGVIWAVRQDAVDADVFISTFHGKTGVLISTRSLDLPQTVGPDALTHIIARGGNCCVSVASQLIFVPSSFPVGELFSTEMSFPITGLAATCPMTRLRIAVTGPEGGAVFWPDDRYFTRFGDGLFDPVATFTRTGELVVIGRGEGRIYQTTLDRKVSMLAKFEIGSPTGPPSLAVLPGAKLSEFAVISREGLVQVHQAPMI